MKDSKEFWDKSARKYIKRPVKDEATYQKKLAITRQFLRPDSKVLEFGCGSGATAISHAPYVDHVVATDISDEMIKSARLRASEAGVKNVVFQQGTLEDIKLAGGSFDAVLGLNVLHLLDDVDGTIAEVHHLLKDGGVFISSTSLIAEINVAFRWLITGMQLLGLAPYVSRFTRGQLVSGLSEAGFTIEKEWRPGRESVFIVARKAFARTQGMSP